MKLLLNPVMLKLIGLGLLMGVVLVLGFVAVRKIRNEAISDMRLVPSAPRTDAPNFALAACQGVIAGLKQAELQLQSRLDAEKIRRESLESIHHLILDNVGDGVMLLTPNLLVQEANLAARSLLGYASPVNMHVREVFCGLHGVGLSSSDGAVGGIGQAVRDVLGNATEYRDIPARYSTPAGKESDIRITLLPVMAGQQVTSVLCLIRSAPAFTLPFPVLAAGKNAAKPE
jgi:PAS domain-containing protein